MKSFLGILLLLVATVSANEFATIGEAIFKNLFAPQKLQTIPRDDFTVWNPFVDFYKGFAFAINNLYKQDLSLVDDCIAAPQEVWKVWLEFGDYVKNITWSNFQIDEFIGAIIDLVGGTVSESMPCVTIVFMLDKFIELILDPDWDTVKSTFLKSLASNFQTVMGDAFEFFMSIIKGDFFTAGQDVGEVLYLLIIH